jgi:hypothetical protein
MFSFTAPAYPGPNRIAARMVIIFRILLLVLAPNDIALIPYFKPA